MTATKTPLCRKSLQQRGVFWLVQNNIGYLQWLKRKNDIKKRIFANGGSAFLRKKGNGIDLGRIFDSEALNVKLEYNRQGYAPNGATNLQ